MFDSLEVICLTIGGKFSTQPDGGEGLAKRKTESQAATKQWMEEVVELKFEDVDGHGILDLVVSASNLAMK